MSVKKKINCRKCKHFNVTWNKNFPYACNAYGFKGKNMPSIAVLINSGKECLLFEEKAQKKKNDKKNIIV